MRPILKSRVFCGLGLVGFSLLLPIFLPLWTTYWPSIAAMVMVIITRQATMGLAFGALTGAYYLNLAAPLGALSDLVGNHLVSSMASPWNASILLFTLIFAGFAGILGAGGGLQMLARHLSPWICFVVSASVLILIARHFRPSPPDSATAKRSRMD